MVVCNDWNDVVVVVLVSGLTVISGVGGIRESVSWLVVDFVLIVVGGINVVVLSPIVDGLIAVTLGLAVFTL